MFVTRFLITLDGEKKIFIFCKIIYILYIQGSLNAALGEIAPDAGWPHTWHFTIIKNSQQTQGVDAEFPVPGEENWCFFQIWIPPCVFCVQCLVLELLPYQISEEVIRSEVIKCYLQKWDLWWKQWFTCEKNICTTLRQLNCLTYFLENFQKIVLDISSSIISAQERKLTNGAKSWHKN